MEFSELTSGFSSIANADASKLLFAKMCRWFLSEAEAYRGRFEELWLWDELGRCEDAGIDIVALASDGECVAIQARAWNSVPMVSDVRLFLKESSSMRFKRRMLMCAVQDAKPAIVKLLAKARCHSTELALFENFSSAGLDWSRWRVKLHSPSKPAMPLSLPLKALRHLNSLTEERILAWADDYHARTGKWPAQKSGRAGYTTWVAIDLALRKGLRGLPKGSSLARLLYRRRGVVNKLMQSTLTEGRILGWADEHRSRTGRWPVVKSGPIVAAPGESWDRIDSALALGHRGLPKGKSLAKLLNEARGARNISSLPEITEEAILGWADEHYKRNGSWPTFKSGPVGDTTWQAIDVALIRGRRGLPGGSTLARLLASRRNVKNMAATRRLTTEQILIWADLHHDISGRWPSVKSGPISGAREETWAKVDSALSIGLRGLPKGSSLAKLLAERRGARNIANLPKLTEELILSLADDHFARTGKWPSCGSGPAYDTSWSSIDNALSKGFRGLPGGSSLAKLLASRKRRLRRDR